MLRSFVSTSVYASTVGIGGVAAADQVTNTTTETMFCQYYPLGYLGYPTTAGDGTVNQFGGAIRVTGFGYLSTGATPGTLELRARLGVQPNRITGTVLGTTGAFTPPASLANAYFKFEGLAVFRTSAPTQTSTQGRFEGHLMIQGAANAPFLAGIVNAGTGITGFAAAVAINQGSLAFQVSAQWGTASAANIITMSQLAFEAITQEL
jgi:hypothetical protein